MYESPIAIITTEMESSIDDEVLRVTQKIGIDVNKDELLKALKYDRGQYEKDYADGKAVRETGRWIPYLKKGLKWKCSRCDSKFTTPFRFCPNCGAEMEW